MIKVSTSRTCVAKCYNLYCNGIILYSAVSEQTDGGLSSFTEEMFIIIVIHLICWISVINVDICYNIDTSNEFKLINIC